MAPMAPMAPMVPVAPIALGFASFLRASTAGPSPKQASPNPLQCSTESALSEPMSAASAASLPTLRRCGFLSSHSYPPAFSLCCHTQNFPFPPSPPFFLSLVYQTPILPFPFPVLSPFPLSPRRCCLCAFLFFVFNQTLLFASSTLSSPDVVVVGRHTHTCKTQDHCAPASRGTYRAYSQPPIDSLSANNKTTTIILPLQRTTERASTSRSDFTHRTKENQKTILDFNPKHPPTGNKSCKRDCPQPASDLSSTRLIREPLILALYFFFLLHFQIVPRLLRSADNSATYS